jgi:lipopolysaccharide biosynthesis glycosyltransferase
MDLVRAHFRGYGATVNFILADDAQLKKFHVHGHLATPTYYRALCAQMLPAEVDRVLCIDCDVIVRDALDEIYATDLGPHTVAAVRDGFLSDAPWRAKINALVGATMQQYFNSGVMVIDVARYRSSGVGAAVLALLERFHRDFQYADQDALNVVLDQRWKALPARWNVQSHWYTINFWARAAALPPERRALVLAAIRSPAIIHYTTKSKPWDFMNAHPLKREYWKYRSLTPYAPKRRAAQIT